MNKDLKNNNNGPQKVIGSLLAGLVKSILLGLLKGIILLVYFLARVTETISHNLAEHLKKHTL